MLLKSELNGWKVTYGTGETIGKVHDVVVDTQRANWPVTALVLSHGIGRGRDLLDVPTDELSVDAHERTLTRRGHTPLARVGSTVNALDHLHLGSLKGARVYSSDDQLLGRAYDFAIATSPPGGWLVWRFLVQTPGARTRRLRLHVADIESVAQGKIVLKAQKDEIRGAV